MFCYIACQANPDSKASCQLGRPVSQFCWSSVSRQPVPSHSAQPTPKGRVPSETLICSCCFAYQVTSYTEAPRIECRSRRKQYLNKTQCVAKSRLRNLPALQTPRAKGGRGFQLLFVIVNDITISQWLIVLRCCMVFVVTIRLRCRRRGAKGAGSSGHVRAVVPSPGAPSQAAMFMGSHLSNTACLPHAFFKSGEWCGNLWWFLTRRRTRKTNETVLDT